MATLRKKPTSRLDGDLNYEADYDYEIVYKAERFNASAGAFSISIPSINFS